MWKWIKILFVSLGSFVAILILAAVVFGIFIGNPQDKESKIVSEQMTKAICANWSLDILRESADPDLLAVITPDQKIKPLFSAFSDKLGTLVSISETSGTSGDYFDFSKMQLSVTANYAVKVKFVKGDGIVNIGLRKRDGDWKLLNFHVVSASTDSVPRQHLIVSPPKAGIVYPPSAPIVYPPKSTHGVPPAWVVL